MSEIWKDIPEYEGIYEASSCGRIRSKEGKTTYTQRHGVRHWKSRVMKVKGKREMGYRVALWKDGKQYDWSVARLVCMTFHDIPEKGMTVNHKDGDRLNNKIENLEWLTLKDNIRHGFENDLYKQTHVALVDSNMQKHEFKSLSKASKWLGRNHGYLSNAIKKNREIKSKDGDAFKVA